MLVMGAVGCSDTSSAMTGGGTDSGGDTAGDRVDLDLGPAVEWLGVDGLDLGLLVTQDALPPHLVVQLESGTEVELAVVPDLDSNPGSSGEGQAAVAARVPLQLLADLSENIKGAAVELSDGRHHLPLALDPVALAIQLDRHAELPQWRQQVNDALGFAGLSEKDVDPWGSSTIDFGEDPLRLAVVEQTLRQPMELAGVGRQTMTSLSPTTASLAASVRTAARLRQWPVARDVPRATTVSAAVPEALRPLVAAVELAAETASAIDRTKLPDIFQAIRGGFNIWNQSHTHLTLIPEAQAMPWGAVVDAAIIVAREVDRLMADPDLAASIGEFEPQVIDLPCGPLILGSTGADNHGAGACMILDPGGDDTYQESATTTDGPVAVVIDLGGQDRYDGGTGFLGVSLVADLGASADEYVGDDLGHGVGVFGIGMLVDDGGNDMYTATDGSQGFGYYGLGLLLDVAGDDSYDADILAQGSALPGGLGALLDTAGRDHYFVGGVYPDLARNDTEHFLGFGQGFSIGGVPSYMLTEGAPGGWGLLVDGAGNDHYEAEVMVQGAGYWFGIGGLFDLGGDDLYQAYNYAHAQAVHIAAAILIDSRGDDRYTSPMRSQGRGDDRSVAMLLEDGGHDVYENETKIGQGAGAREGSLGLLSDWSGDDSYYAGRQSQGWVSQDDYRPTYAPMSLLIDFAGDDDYQGSTSKPGNGKQWIKNGRGVGADLPLSEPPP